MTIEEIEQKVIDMEQRIVALEADNARLRAYFTPTTQNEPGYKVIQSDSRRTESGMGALLNTNSQFI